MVFGRRSTVSALLLPAFAGLLPFPLSARFGLRGVEVGPEFEFSLLVSLTDIVSALEVLASLVSGVFGGEILTDEEPCVTRCLSFGTGKLDFLSMASTCRWKRRKRDSARTRVDSRSIVLDSSFTANR
jgi:hypothetical protein